MDRRGEYEVKTPKSIIEKLSLHKYSTKLILHKPDDIKDFDELEYDTSVKNDKYDLVFVFIFQLDDLSKQLKLIIKKDLLNEKGYLFFAYPKKNNPQYKEYIERDQIFPEIKPDEDGYVLGSMLKFSRMVSLNEVFTIVGLKAEPKKQNKSQAEKKSQCVDDYVQHIKDIQQFLADDQPVLQVYNDLTPGYQKNWARYVYSAKRKETQEKRLQEMKEILKEGYKSIDLYRSR